MPPNFVAVSTSARHSRRKYGNKQRTQRVNKERYMNLDNSKSNKDIDVCCCSVM